MGQMLKMGGSFFKNEVMKQTANNSSEEEKFFPLQLFLIFVISQIRKTSIEADSKAITINNILY